MKKSTTCLVMALLCLNFARGQHIQTLKIGDKLPEVLWSQTFTTINGEGSHGTVRLGDYRGELIILDFWATWCGGCIRSFPKIDSIQNAFPKDLRFFLVNSAETTDSEKKISEVIQRMERSLNARFTPMIIIGDTVLTQLFQVRTLPHCVWIDKNGVIVRIGNSQDMTIKKVGSILSRQGVIKEKHGADDQNYNKLTKSER